MLAFNVGRQSRCTNNPTAKEHPVVNLSLMAALMFSSTAIAQDSDAAADATASTEEWQPAERANCADIASWQDAKDAADRILQSVETQVSETSALKERIEEYEGPYRPKAPTSSRRPSRAEMRAYDDAVERYEEEVEVWRYVRLAVSNADRQGQRAQPALQAFLASVPDAMMATENTDRGLIRQYCWAVNDFGDALPNGRAPKKDEADTEDTADAEE